MSDDFQFILYIILAILYFLTRGLSKKKKKGKPPQRPPQGQPSQPTQESERQDRPITLEEMLRDIGRDFEDEEKLPEKEDSKQEYSPEHSDSEIRDKFEASVKEAQDVKTLDEQVDLEDLEFKRIEVYQEEEDEGPQIDLKEIAGAFHDPQSARKAIIYKEILDRKYF